MQKMRTEKEWEEYYAKHHPKEEKKMTEAEFKRKKYLETVKGRFGKVAERVKGAIEPQTQGKKKKGSQGGGFNAGDMLNRMGSGGPFG